MMYLIYDLIYYYKITKMGPTFIYNHVNTIGIEYIWTSKERIHSFRS